MSLYRNQKHHLYKHPLHRRIFFFLISFVLIIITATFISTEFHSIYPRHLFTVFQRITLPELLLYTFYTLSRVVVSYFIGLIMTLVVLLIVVAHKKIENFLVPIFDILQSVPVLAFFPLIIVTFARLHLPEMAAQIVLIVAMFWSVLFGALGGYHQIPEDVLDAAKLYNAKGWRLFVYVILPAIVPSLVIGSILSFGAGWNVIIISEFINYGNIQIRLPGLGNLLSSSAGSDSGIFVLALLALVIVILLIDRLVWRPLTNYSEKFKFE